MDYISLRLTGIGAYHDICDAVQDTYMEFLKLIKRKGTSYAANPLALLTVIAGTRIKRIYGRKHARSLMVSLSVGSDEEDEQANVDLKDEESEAPYEEVVDRALVGQVLASLHDKDEESVRIFLLRYERDMKLEDIAKELGLELYTVKNKLYRKIVELRKVFGVEG